ncbi:hypothetical protein L2E82_44851 [Cichorium intybus]|uniref:Uncharacterized protein n=1 Tax=Cichorium intybus TaxID=13427 RepID=A0ACB8ZS89_CICIN|nr:hypothetical protein L2E82_44851 [Cichorium intybus]
MGTMGFDVGIISKGSGSTNGKKSSGGIFISESTDDELMEHEDASILETNRLDLQVNEPVAGNYYPINLGADVRYESMEMSALVDRAVGRASLVNGQIQLMLYRKQESKVRVGVIALYFGFFSENRNLK